jgi:TPR repeat protein
MYAEGRGGERNEQRAVYWFYRAACAGNDVARGWLSASRQQWREDLSVDV